MPLQAKPGDDSRAAKSKLALRVLLTCCVVYLLSFFLRNSTAIFAPDVQQALGFSTSTIGLLSGGTMAAYGLMQMPSGVLADVFGGRRVIFWLTVLAGLGSLGFALSPNQGAAIASRALIGIGISVYVPSMAMLAAYLPAGRYSFGLGLMGACGGVGGILAASPVVLLNAALGWRVAVACSAVIAFGVALVFFGLTRDANPKDANPTDANEPLKEPVSMRAIMEGLGTVLRSRRFWPHCLWQMTAIGVTFMMVSLWWFPYLTDSVGFSPLQAGNMLAVASLTVIISGPITAWLSDRVFKARRIPLIVCSVLSFICALLWVVLADKPLFGLHLLQVALFTVGRTGGAILNFTMVREIFPINLIGTASGCVNMLYPVWAAVLQVVFGVMLGALMTRLEPAAAYSAASWLMVGNLAVAVVCSFLMKETLLKQPLQK